MALLIHAFYAKKSFLDSTHLNVVKLTTLPYLSFGTTIYESRFAFDNPKEFHPLMPTIQYKSFIYE